MNRLILSSLPHTRFNPLKGEWILVSPQRAKRPWLGQTERSGVERRSAYDPTCYLCPGNLRANGEKTPEYKNTFVFTNDYQAIYDVSPESVVNGSDLFTAKTVKGECRVVCFSPRHDKTLAHLEIEEIEQVIDTWIMQIDELKKRYEWVQVFENKGSQMGASNPHPHGQIWASNFIPDEVAIEDMNQKKYFEKHNSPLLVDYVKEEAEKKERVVIENKSWVVVVPFWAVWPFETLLLPKEHKIDFTSLSQEEKKDLADIMKKLLVVYDKVFNTSMPYSMGWHFAPCNSSSHEHWQLHAHYYPPLLRSASVRKFMVGYEMLAEPQRDITPEQAATGLRLLI